MSLEQICNELDEMNVDYHEQDAELTNVHEVVIPITDVSASKARQIEFLCTSNEGIVNKNTDEWVVQNL